MLWSKTRSGRGGTRLSGMCRPKIDRLSTDRSTDRSVDTTTVNKIQLSWVKVKRLENPGGGGTPHMKGVGMLVGNFALNP